MTWQGAVAAAACCAVWSARARVSVDTVPPRSSVQLTIYNAVDLTMVRETRHLTLRKGVNRIEFSWANTLIDPTSVEFKALTHPDEVDVLDASFPPRVTNTLEWSVQSGVEGDVAVEIQYFTSGVSWSADYVVEADRREKSAGLSGFVRVTNQSGEDYENAQIRLVVGVVKLVEDIATLARQAVVSRASPEQPFGGGVGGIGGAVAENRLKLVFDAAKPAEIRKEGLSEYFLYTVAGRDTIPNGWSKRLPSISAAAVPLTGFCKYEEQRWGRGVERFYRFKNDKAGRLGVEPLPNGAVEAFRLAGDDGLHDFVGSTSVKYIPVNEQVDLDLGADREVMVTAVLTGWRKDGLRFDANGNVSGWTVTEDWSLEAQNSRDIPVTVDLRRDFSGDWSVTSPGPFEKMDAGRIKFLLALAPREKRTVEYQLVTRYGTDASR